MSLIVYNCRRCKLRVSSECSKCHRVIDVKKIDDDCLVKKLKCRNCSNSPIIKDICILSFERKD